MILFFLVHIQFNEFIRLFWTWFHRSQNKTIELKTIWINKSWTFDVIRFLLCWVILQLFESNSSHLKEKIFETIWWWNSFELIISDNWNLKRKHSNDQIFFSFLLMDQNTLALIFTRYSSPDQIDHWLRTVSLDFGKSFLFNSKNKSKENLQSQHRIWTDLTETSQN